jgi:hypothetical protein
VLSAQQLANRRGTAAKTRPCSIFDYGLPLAVDGGQVQVVVAADAVFTLTSKASSFSYSDKGLSPSGLSKIRCKLRRRMAERPRA